VLVHTRPTIAVAVRAGLLPAALCPLVPAATVRALKPTAPRIVVVFEQP